MRGLPEEAVETDVGYFVFILFYVKFIDLKSLNYCVTVDQDPYTSCPVNASGKNNQCARKVLIFFFILGHKV